MAEQPVQLKRGKQKRYPRLQRTIQLNLGDQRMVEEMSEFLGCSYSDVHRTAIRTLYVKLLGKSA